MRSLTKILRPLLIALLAAACLPVAADATMLVYRDGDNVWEASPDGTIKRPVTTDGTADTYYSYPSVDDAGTVTAMKNSGSTHVIWVKARGAATPTMNVMPWKAAGWPNIGPNWARVKPTSGSLLTYTYFLNYGPFSGQPNGGLVDRFAIVTPTAPGSPTQPAIDQPAVGQPTWYGDRLVGGRGGRVVYESSPLSFVDWLGNPTTALEGAEVSRDGTRILVDEATGRLEFLGYQGTIPTGTVTWGCLLPATGVTRWAMSPEGTWVAWVDAAGLHVATVTASNADVCPISGHVLLSSTGTTPAFSTATLSPPVDPGDPTHTTTTQTTPTQTQTTTTSTQTTPTQTQTQTTPTQTQTTPTTTGPHTTTPTTKTTPTTQTTPTTTTTVPDVLTPKLAVGAIKKAKAATLRKGVTATVTAPGAGTVTATLRSGTRTLGTAKVSVKTAGKRTVSVRPTKAGAKRIKRGTKLTLQVRWAPKTGAPVTRAATVVAG